MNVAPGRMEEILEEAVDTFVVDVAAHHNKLALAVELKHMFEHINLLFTLS
jgi:hypothetical protein